MYQDVAVAPAMTIAENLFLGRELRRPGVLGRLFRLLDKKKMLAQASAYMQDLQIGIRSMKRSRAPFATGKFISAELGQIYEWRRSCPDGASRARRSSESD